jgi:hypothetical protein
VVFPERPNAERGHRNGEPLWLVPVMYVPALILGAARVIAVSRASQGTLSGPVFSRILEALDRSEPVYLFLYAAAALWVLVRAFREITLVTGRRQLRWIAWGTALGVGLRNRHDQG